ncbi:MAG TPA: hypothetical protein EYH07_15905 [Kiloniellaceae bacterium]|nr:hypothetical protein [Kiloniellaceae bacterium]
MLLSIGVIYFLMTINLRSLGLPIGEWPRVPLYVYTTNTVTMTFDGQEITIEGTTRCKRRFELDEDGDLWLPLIMHIGFTYHCGPEWLAHRFEDGSALLVGAYSNSSTWRRALSGFLRGLPAQRSFDGDAMSALFNRVPPAVVWLDNAETPTRAEYYYSMVALEDPRSRLTAIQHDAEVWPASRWTSLFTGRSPSDHSAEVPALVHPSNLHRMVGHYAVELSEDRWSKVTGLKEALAALSEPTLILPREQISEELSKKFGYEVLRDMRHLPPHYMKHGLGAIPLAIATGRGEEGRRGFVPPIRSVVPETFEFRRFRFEDSLPDGALLMFPGTLEQQSDPVSFDFGDSSASGIYRRMWFGGQLYNPATNTIYYTRTINF